MGKNKNHHPSPAPQAPPAVLSSPPTPPKTPQPALDPAGNHAGQAESSTSVEHAKPTTTKALEGLQSEKQKKALDTVDQLRTCGFTNAISLPQIVVCGDQSAGKSSVLEALTEINFPRADNLCTRHATEIIMRRGDKEHVNVRIIPDIERPPSEQEALKTFNEAVKSFDDLTNQLGEIIDKAKVAMGIGTSASSGGQKQKTFSSDILSIEIQGPNRPQFTVVDLPGIFQNEDQIGDKKLVDNLTERFINEGRTICLAVISTTNDADNQIILTQVKKADPEGKRSMGIITKPDLLSKDSDSERSFIKLALNQNSKYLFKLGWHVLKNRKFEERDVNFDERNRLEAEFFRDSNFKHLKKTSYGIESLRVRLSDILYKHVRRELPGIQDEVYRLIDETEAELGKLGQSRSTAKDCIDYLVDISSEVSSLCKQALSGHVESEFFDSSDVFTFDDNSRDAMRRLGALLQTKNSKFSSTMRTQGHYLVVESEPVPTDGNHFVSEQHLKSMNKRNPPICVSYGTAMTWVLKAKQRNRGRELQDQHNPLTITELYKTLSLPWEKLAQDYVEEISRNCIAFMQNALEHVCSKDVEESMWVLHVREQLESREKAALDELRKMIQPYRDHPINANPAYMELLEKTSQSRKKRQEEYFAKTGSAPTASKSAADLEWFSCQQALDSVLAIYEVKREVFIDNVLSHIIQMHLISGLEDVVSPRWAGKLTEEQALSLAAEPSELQGERTGHEDQLKRLRAGQKILKDMMGGI